MWLLSSLLVLGLAGGCTAKPDDSTASFNHRLNSLVKPYTFNYADWEFKTLYSHLKQTNRADDITSDSEPDIVIRFFASTPDSQDPALKARVENILASQISQVLAEEGIYNPFINLHFTFPPVYFKLEEPPYILVVSPRDKIERLRDVTLKQDLSLTKMEELESGIEQLNVSALVVPIGGLGATFPSFVSENSDLNYTLKTASEEWLHQYLTFKPLGFRYVLELLRIKPDADITSLNETVAGLAAKELGDLVYAKFYVQYMPKPEKPSDQAAFDYDAALRETRLTVDTYLASGQVAQAESYMEERRQLINDHGYLIRRLNQAYFAFYGSYTYRPASVDPLGDQVRALRQQSPNLKAFLQTVSGLSSRQELTGNLKNKP